MREPGSPSAAPRPALVAAVALLITLLATLGPSREAAKLELGML